MTESGTVVSGRLPAGALVANEYVVDSYLGGGALARVYLVHHLANQTSYALKVAREPDNNTIRREVDCLRRCDTPLLGTVYDAGRMPEGHPYLVRDLVDGHCLQFQLSEVRGNVPFGINVGLRLAHTLSILHLHGFLHRDVKPANVLVPVIDDVPEARGARLVDFDLCRRMDDVSLTGTHRARPGQPHGTYLYMAPEAFRGMAATTSADVYGLGATIHEIIVGAAPFAGERIDLTVREKGRTNVYVGPFVLRKLSEDPVVPDKEGLAEELRRFLQRMLSREPAERPDLFTDIIPYFTELCYA
jgi:serine/threonine protein kinase